MRSTKASETLLQIRSKGDWAESIGLSAKVNKWFRIGYELNLILISTDRTKINSAWQLDYADHENVITKTNSALDQKLMQ